MIGELVNHLWQSTAFALALAALTLLLRNNGAHVRYGLWFAASIKFLVPFSMFTAIGRWIGGYAAPIAAPPSMIVAVQTFAAPLTTDVVASAPELSHATAFTYSIMALWAFGFLLVVTVWFVKWRRIAHTLRLATPVALPAPIPVRAAPSVLEPGVVGIFQPVLLLPEGIDTQLSPRELHDVLAHEFCHVRRRDNLTAAFHMVVQAVFWFHPLVWWIGSRLMDERERACDEAVLAAGGDSETYAEGILKVCKLYVEAPRFCVAGISGADLKARIERIMLSPVTERVSTLKRGFFAMIVAAVVAGPIVGGWASSGGAADSKARAIPLFYDVHPMVVNLNTPGYFLKLSASLDVICVNQAKCEDSDFWPIDEVLPRIIDSYQQHIRGLKVEDLQGQQGADALRAALFSRTTSLVAPARIKAVLFKEMIVTDKP